MAPRIAGARFLDLFAGSGIFAFEAVSRGALTATAIDIAPRNTAAMQRLATEWKADVKAVTGDALRTIHRLDTTFDLIYADPPYDFPDYDELLLALDRSSCVAADALVTIEHRRKTQPFRSQTTRLQELRRAEYGEVWMTMWEAASTSSETDRQ